MTEIRIEDLDDKDRKIIRALGNVNKAHYDMEYTSLPDDFPDAIKAVEEVGQALTAAWTVLRAHARDIAMRHSGNKYEDFVRFHDAYDRTIAYLIIKEKEWL